MKRLLATLPAGALSRTSGGRTATSIPVSELAAIDGGGNPEHRTQLEPNGFGIRVATDTVRSISQQYAP